MSVIGPRPGLWNQDVLTAERDKYGANDVKPGLTGWAQIIGRCKLYCQDPASGYSDNHGKKSVRNQSNRGYTPDQILYSCICRYGYCSLVYDSDCRFWNFKIFFYFYLYWNLFWNFIFHSVNKKRIKYIFNYYEEKDQKIKGVLF